MLLGPTLLNNRTFGELDLQSVYRRKCTYHLFIHCFCRDLCSKKRKQKQTQKNTKKKRKCICTCFFTEYTIYKMKLPKDVRDFIGGKFLNIYHRIAHDISTLWYSCFTFRGD